MGAADPSDLHDTFYQEPNFEYLTGWHEPGAALLLTPKDEVLFLPPRVANRETSAAARPAPMKKMRRKNPASIRCCRGPSSKRSL